MENYTYLRWKLMVNYIEVIFVNVGRQLGCVFIFDETLRFSPNNVYLRELVNNTFPYKQ